MECHKIRATLLANLCLCNQKIGKFEESVKKGKEAFQLILERQLDDDDLKCKLYCRLVKSYYS